MEAEVLEQIVERHGDAVYRVSLQYTGSPADAEDVLQEVLLERCRRGAAFPAPEEERRWLLRVAVNKSKNVLRAHRRRRSIPLEAAAELPAPPQPEYRALYDAVRALPQNQRLAVDLFYYEGYSTVEIAALLSTREATVRTWLRRARLKLKELLKEAWDDD